LTLREVDCTPSAESDARFPPQIVSFVLDRGSDSGLAAIISWVKTGQGLRSLSFRLATDVDYGLVTGLLHTYSDTLTELELNFGSLGRFSLHAKYT
jgi:hypothetical protein